jgi:hypothetical protein
VGRPRKWPIRRIAEAVPKSAALARAEFTTLRLWLLKVAARYRSRAQAYAHIARAAMPPTPPNPALQPEKPIDPSTVQNSGDGARPRQTPAAAQASSNPLPSVMNKSR